MQGRKKLGGFIGFIFYLFIHLGKVLRCMLRGRSMVGIEERVLGQKRGRTVCQNAFRKRRWEKNGINDELSWPWCWIHWIGAVLQRKTCLTQFRGYAIHKYSFLHLCVDELEWRKGSVKFLTIVSFFLKKGKKKTMCTTYTFYNPCLKADWRMAAKTEEKQSDKEALSFTTQEREEENEGFVVQRFFFPLSSSIFFFFFYQFGSSFSASLVCCYCVWELLCRRFSVFS